MDDYVKMIAPSVAALLAFVGWFAQRHLEHRASERERKELLYRNLLTSMAILNSAGEAAPLLIEYQEAWLYASDEVLKDLQRYIAIVARQDPESDQVAEELRLLQGRIRLGIRRHIYPGTSIDDSWLRNNYQAIASDPKSVRAYLDKRGSFRKDA